MTLTSSGQARNEAIRAARLVITRHIQALNAGDENGLAATLHFPHFRLAGEVLKTWDTPKDYFSDFKTRAGPDWHHTIAESIDVITASRDKVHLDIAFARNRQDRTTISRFRSLWVITRINGVWAAQLRSTFAR